MAGTEDARGQEVTPVKGEDIYDRTVRVSHDLLKRYYEGKVVVKAKDRPLESTRQGWLRHYLFDHVLHDTVLKDWRVLVHEIHKHSGKHTHQGGLVIFILDGEGYTIVDGEKVEWKKGDLILLPIKPGGVEHQHFDRNPDRPARFLAMIYGPFQDVMAHFMEQKEDSPHYQSINQ